METSIRITAVTTDRSRIGTRVAPNAGAADARADQNGAGSTAGSPAPSQRALVPLETPSADRPGFARPQPSAPFITQLAGHQPAGGERRTRRDPAMVAPRAAGAYRATGRLASDLEPGFIVVREV